MDLVYFCVKIFSFRVHLLTKSWPLHPFLSNTQGTRLVPVGCYSFVDTNSVDTPRWPSIVRLRSLWRCVRCRVSFYGVCFLIDEVPQLLAFWLFTCVVEGSTVETVLYTVSYRLRNPSPRDRYTESLGSWSDYGMSGSVRRDNFRECRD